MTINTEFRNRVSFQHIGFGEHTRARAAPFPLIAAEEQICSAVELTVTRVAGDRGRIIHMVLANRL